MIELKLDLTCSTPTVRVHCNENYTVTGAHQWCVNNTIQTVGSYDATGFIIGANHLHGDYTCTGPLPVEIQCVYFTSTGRILERTRIVAPERLPDGPPRIFPPGSLPQDTSTQDHVFPDAQTQAQPASDAPVLSQSTPRTEEQDSGSVLHMSFIVLLTGLLITNVFMY